MITDEKNEPVVGATVQIKEEPTKGTVSDAEGNFTLLAGKDQTLIISYVGMQTCEVAVASQLYIVLLPDTEQLDEVIVVAYGTASKAGYTGSASTVNTETISRAQVSNVSRLLQGTASGIQSVASSGQPGSEASIYIRGIGSINASSTPLYIVDGAPYDGNLNSINPADIESISVLKDAASTSIYGSRAGNGLIIITTKQGRKENKPQIDINFKYGPSFRAVSDYHKISTDEYWQLYWEAMRNQELYTNGKTPETAAAYASANIVQSLGINPYGAAYPQPVGNDGKLVAGASPLWDDDWTREYTQQAHRSEGQIGLSGGGKTSTYFISLGYLDDQGIAPASDFKRYTGRINLNSDLKPWLKLSAGISLTHSVQNAPQSEDSNLANSLNFARSIPNFYPIWERNPDGSFKIDMDGNRIYDFGNYRPSAVSPRYNHLGTAIYDFNRVFRDLASIRTSVEVALLKGFTYKGSLNIDYTNRVNHDYTNPEIGSSSYKDNPGSVTKANYRTAGFTGNNILTYTTTLNDLHNIKILAGQEYYEYNNSRFEGSREGFPALGLTEPDAASTLIDFSGSSDRYRLLSFFGNAEYNYRHRYYGSASLRTDGSSRFSPQSRWGIFWSVGVSWRLSEEGFIRNIPQISSLTLRASYGGQGNDNLGTYYAYKALFSISNNLGESGFLTSSLENNDLKWETNLNLNFGIDFGLFNNRLKGSVEVFDRRSSNLLFEIPKPRSIGYTSYSANTGSMKNTGVEISLNGNPVKTKEFEWTLFANATHYKNVITSLPQKQIEAGNKLRRVGGSIYDFFLVEWAGINPDNGLPQWYKTNSEGQREVTATYNEANKTASKIIAGTSLPSLSGGFGTEFRYAGFELSALFAYSLGGKIYNGDKLSILHNGSSAGRAMSVDMLNRWTPENRDTDIPRLQTNNANAWINASTRFLINADYLRLKNITLGYNLPKTVLQRIGINDLKFYAQAENLFTLFGEQGIDPEQTVSGSTYYRYPAMKTLAFGINISF